MVNLGFPYVEFRISAPLSPTQYAALSAPMAAAPTATVSGNDITVGGQTIDSARIVGDVKSFAPNRQYGRIPRHSLAHRNVRQVAGRQTWEATLEIYNEGLAKSNIVEVPEGHRVLYAIRAPDQIMVAVVDIVGVSEPALDEAGDLVITVTMTNSGGFVPTWAT